jgi:hypothetical protein
MYAAFALELDVFVCVCVCVCVYSNVSCLSGYGVECGICGE